MAKNRFFAAHGDDEKFLNWVKMHHEGRTGAALYEELHRILGAYVRCKEDVDTTVVARGKAEAAQNFDREYTELAGQCQRLRSEKEALGQSDEIKFWNGLCQLHHPGWSERDPGWDDLAERLRENSLSSQYPTWDEMARKHVREAGAVPPEVQEYRETERELERSQQKSDDLPVCVQYRAALQAAEAASRSLDRLFRNVINKSEFLYFWVQRWRGPLVGGGVGHAGSAASAAAVQEPTETLRQKFESDIDRDKLADAVFCARVLELCKGACGQLFDEKHNPHSHEYWDYRFSWRAAGLEEVNEEQSEGQAERVRIIAAASRIITRFIGKVQVPQGISQKDKDYFAGKQAEAVSDAINTAMKGFDWSRETAPAAGAGADGAAAVVEAQAAAVATGGDGADLDANARTAYAAPAGAEPRGDGSGVGDATAATPGRAPASVAGAESEGGFGFTERDELGDAAPSPEQVARMVATADGYLDEVMDTRFDEDNLPSWEQKQALMTKALEGLEFCSFDKLCAFSRELLARGTGLSRFVRYERHQRLRSSKFGCTRTWSKLLDAVKEAMLRSLRQKAGQRETITEADYSIVRHCLQTHRHGGLPTLFSVARRGKSLDNLGSSHPSSGKISISYDVRTKVLSYATQSGLVRSLGTTPGPRR